MVYEPFLVWVELLSEQTVLTFTFIYLIRCKHENSNILKRWEINYLK